MRLLPVVALILLARPLAAQEPFPPDAYQDPGARELVRLARERRAAVDTRITAYEATARERFSARAGAAGLERLVFRRETAARINWTRDTVRIELLGAREAQPMFSAGAQRVPPDIAGMLPSLAFDPAASEMLLELDSTGIKNPLAPGSEAQYRFESGDTTAIRLPDGRTVRLVELRIAARREAPDLINGSFWLDAETHAVVRAAARIRYSSSASGVYLLMPAVAGEVEVAIDYGLWDVRWWLPRSVIARGVVGAAGIRMPITYERSYEGYRVVGDTTPVLTVPGEISPPGEGRPCRPVRFGSVTLGAWAISDSTWDAGWSRTVARLAEDSAAMDQPGRDSTETRDPDTRRSAADQSTSNDTASEDSVASGREPCDRAFLVTRTPGDLVDSPIFTGSVYDEDHGPLSVEQIAAVSGLLKTAPEIPWGSATAGLQLLPLDLMRFNRVEGFSAGSRATVSLGPGDLRGEVRAGTTGEVGARMDAAYNKGSALIKAGAYRGLEAVDVASQPFAVTSSASAFLLGRDENDYFRGTGVELRLAPASLRRQSWELRLFAERQRPVTGRADHSLRGLLDNGFDTRANLLADPVDQAGLMLGVRGVHGDDPGSIRTRVNLDLHGETGDRRFARALLRVGADRLLGGGVGAAATLTGGISSGNLPTQRLWQIGGATTVRGHDPATLRGESLWLARGELTRGGPMLRWSIFGDAGWAGARRDWSNADPILGAGVGVSLLDNLVRIDLARGSGNGGYRVYLRLGGGI